MQKIKIDEEILNAQTEKKSEGIPKPSKKLIECLENLKKNSLIKIEKNSRQRKMSNELSVNKFKNSYIFFGNLNEISNTVRNIFIIIGHESSGRTAFIQTMLNYLEGKDQNTLVTERFIKIYKHNKKAQKEYYNFGMDSQMDN